MKSEGALSSGPAQATRRKSAAEEAGIPADLMADSAIHRGLPVPAQNPIAADPALKQRPEIPVRIMVGQCRNSGLTRRLWDLDFGTDFAGGFMNCGPQVAGVV
jgi:hypothetical protein